jgi:hypothetical protein
MRGWPVGLLPGRDVPGRFRARGAGTDDSRRAIDDLKTIRAAVGVAGYRGAAEVN